MILSTSPVMPSTIRFYATIVEDTYVGYADRNSASEAAIQRLQIPAVIKPARRRQR
jgi:hypothetical protein